VADIEIWLNESGNEFDLILAADTLVYLGDLAPVFAGAAARLKPDGFFLFTVEKHESEGYELGPKRRWRHSESYLTSEAFKAGFSVAGLLECVPRMEAKRPVDGFAVALMRRSA
jgi:predicted TPR repeat methyltransferase